MQILSKGGQGLSKDVPGSKHIPFEFLPFYYMLIAHFRKVSIIQPISLRDIAKSTAFEKVVKIEQNFVKLFN